MLPGGHLAISGDIFGCHDSKGEVLPASGRERTEKVLNIYTAQHSLPPSTPPAQNYQTQMPIVPKFRSPVSGYNVGRKFTLAPPELSLVLTSS